MRSRKVKYPLQLKVIILFVSLIILPLLFFTYITYVNVSKEMKDQTYLNLNQSFSETKHGLESIFQSMYYSVQSISQTPMIYETLQSTFDKSDSLKQLEYGQKMLEFIEQTKQATSVDSIKIILEDTNSYIEYNANKILVKESLKEDDWIQKIDQQSELGNNTLWFKPEDIQNEKDSSISITRAIFSPSDYSQRIGVIRTDVSIGQLEALLNRSIITDQTKVYLTYESNPFLTSSNALLNETYTGDIMDLKLLDYSSDYNEWKQVYNGSLYNYKISSLGDTPWLLIMVIPEKDLIVTSIKIRNQMLLIVFLIIFVCSFLAFLALKPAMTRVKKLSHAMTDFENNLKAIDFHKTSQDEIGYLMEDFSRMSHQIEAFIHREYMLSNQLRASELKALQAQINPHFLYNSLNLISCMALDGQDQLIPHIVDDLSRFYRLSVSREKDMISVSHEMEHALLYGRIQQYRYDDALTITSYIDPQVANEKTLKFILQPFIENAVIHGILEKESESGIVSFSAKAKGDQLVYLIEDDGIGMTQEEIEKVLTYTHNSTTGNGYGIMNVMERIQLFYGDEHSIHIDSKPGLGTRIQILIPRKYA